MKKWKKFKNKKKNNPKKEDKKGAKKEDEIKSKLPNEVGIFHDFLVFDRKDYFNDSLEFQDYTFDDPNIKDYQILCYSPNKTKSRFSRLFEEMTENDKKLEDKGEKKENNKMENTNNINIKNNDNKINLINNIDNKNENEKSQLNNINDANENKININTINNDNIIKTSCDKEDEKDNIKESDNNINLSNTNNENNIFGNGPDLLDNANTFDSILLFNNTINSIKDEKPPLSSSCGQTKNIPNQSTNKYDIQKNILNSYSGQYELQKSIFSNFSGIYEKNPYDLKGSLYSNSSGPYGCSTIDSELNFTFSNKSNFSLSDKSSIYESRPVEKKFELNVDIKKVICLEDRRTTVMIKNIPNKFTRDMLLNIIDQNFKGAYDLFILPTDVNRYKNFGYSFINFTCSYYIPYFYFIFNGKKWSSTNSQKICEITYSKIQGRNNLLSHYSNKIIFRNEEAKKYNSEQKFIIPNEYKTIFNQAFPNFTIEEAKYYFITKMPFKY